MPANGLNRGSDTRLIVRDAQGVILETPTVESFEAQENANVVRAIAVDGANRVVKFQQGYSGTFVIQRQGDGLDRYFSNENARYRAGLDQLNVSILETTQEDNGSVSQYRYDGAVLTFAQVGTKSGTDIVRQQVTFEANARVAIA